MSTTTILSAINFNATAAAEKNRTTGAAVALFKKGGKEVNTSEKALGRDCLKGITAEQYETIARPSVLSTWMLICWHAMPQTQTLFRRLKPSTSTI